MNLVVLQNWLDNTAFAVLLVTLLLYWVSAAFPAWTALASLGMGGVAIANLSLATLLAARWLEAGYFPLSNLYESLMFLAWGITAVHLVTEFTLKNQLVGVATAPVALAITAFATLSLPANMQVSEPLVPALKSNWLMMHVRVMLLSYAALMVGSVLSVVFLIVTWNQPIELRGNSIGTGGFRFQAPDPLASESQPAAPSGGGTAVLERVETQAISLTPQRLSLAETLDNISYRVIGLGFPLLTIGIIAGAVWANEAWGNYWSWDPKETWALITWLIFAAYLHARITKGWQGRRPALLAATGFVVVWICYLGVNLLGKGLHSYGWFF
jgi:cytochrome c-type biogenesis protein CcsB